MRTGFEFRLKFGLALGVLGGIACIGASVSGFCLGAPPSVLQLTRTENSWISDQSRTGTTSPSPRVFVSEGEANTAAARIEAADLSGLRLPSCEDLQAIQQESLALFDP